MTLLAAGLFAGTAHGSGVKVTSDLWIKAVIHTVGKGAIEAVWEEGGRGTTDAGDVIWGYFYADPSEVTWGSRENPELFVKMWFDRDGRVDVNYFHVSVPNIEVWSDYPYNGNPDQQGMTTLEKRYIRQYYQDGQAYMDEQHENGESPLGYSPTGNPPGYSIPRNFRIGSRIHTVERGPVSAIWRKGGESLTSGGHQVVWGHFYASPDDVGWGNENNPDLFVKVWFDASGRVDVNFFHVSVPDVDVYSDLPNDGIYDKKGNARLTNRYVRHEYSLTGAQAPVAKFTTALTSDTEPLTVTLDASGSYDPDGTITRYQWTNSEDPGTVQEGVKTEWTLPGEGTYAFGLTVTDDEGLQTTAPPQTAEVKWGTGIPGDAAFDVGELTLTRESPPDNCQSPASETAFSEDDTKVIAWVRYQHFRSGKPYEFRWYSPERTLAQTDEGSRDNYFVEGCSWVSIPTAKLQEHAPGEWTIEFYYDGEKQAETPFTFSAESWGTDFDVTEFVFTADSPKSECETPASRSVFTDNDAEVRTWVRYRHLEKDKSYEFRWYNPNGILAQNNRGTREENVTAGCSWSSMPVETLRDHGSGQWKVEFHYDDQLHREAYFTFASDQAGPGFEITDSTLTGETPGEVCETKPPSQTAFTESDGNVFAWMRYRNIEGGDKTYEFRWYPPKSDGEPAQTNRDTHLNDAGTGCSWGGISVETLLLYSPGQWTVEFHYDGQRRWNGNFTFDYATPFELNDLLLTTESPKAACEAPSSSGTAFDDTAGDLFVWADYRHAESDKAYQFNWYAPDGDLAEKNTGSHAADLKDGCSWIGIPTERLREYGSGQWRVEFLYDGEKYGEKRFTFTPTRPKAFEVTAFLLTAETLPDACQTPGPGTSFGDADDGVTAWLRYRDLEKGKPYEFRWYGPDGSLVKTNTVLDSSDLAGSGCLWNRMTAEALGEYAAGLWTIEFHYDGTLYGKETFTFTPAQTEFELADFILTASSPNADECQRPTAETAFDGDDSEVTAWLRYYRFDTDKTYEFRWHAPTGELAQTSANPPNRTDNSNGCVWESISSEKLQQYSPGQWRVEFYYDGQVYDQRHFTFEYADAGFGITDFLFTREPYDQGNNCNAPVSDSAFSKEDSKITAWIYYHDLERDKLYEFRWHTPANELLQSNLGSASQDVRRGCVWVDISAKSLETKPVGQWRVEFLYDGQKHKTAYFTFE